jgi:hypothetical protein
VETGGGSGEFGEFYGRASLFLHASITIITTPELTLTSTTTTTIIINVIITN